MDPFDLRLWPGFAAAGGKLQEPEIIDQISIDSRRIHSPNALFVALKGEKQDGHQYLQHATQMGAKYVLISTHYPFPPPLPDVQILRVPDPLQAFQSIAKTYRLQLPTKVIGITGSFGKTMTKDLLYSILTTEKLTAASPESFNSQIGVPLSLLTLKKEHKIAIIETAISKKQEMEVLADLVRPDYTILTPIGKKHLATLEDLATLTQEMMKFIFATSSTGWSLLPNDALLKPFLDSLHWPHYFWDLAAPQLPHAINLSQEYTIPMPYKISFPNRQQFKGHATTGYAYFLNLINMAVKAAWLIGISAEKIQEALSHYQLEPSRTEIWKSPMGATFINETYCSDPQSVDLALQHFDYATTHRKIFVFGGMRGQHSHLAAAYRRIGKVLNQAKLDQLILVGEKSFDPLIEEMKNSSTEITTFSTFMDALRHLRPHILPHDLVVVKGKSKVPFDSLIEIFHDSLNNNQCTINLAAIKANLATLRKKLVSQTRIMAVVKAIAYGTDDIRIAKFLASCGIDILGVSYVDEAVTLRRAGVKQAIFSINAAIYEVTKVIKWDLEVGVSDAEFIQTLAKEADKKNKSIKVHLHINTGMGRFGCRPEQALELACLIKNSPNLILEGLMTHFACADDPKEDSFTLEQIACFDHAIANLKKHGIEAKWLHAANSSGAIRFHLTQYNMVRIGLATYGLYVSEATKNVLDLRLALSLTSRIVGINICKKGETVSYGRKYTVEKDMQKIGVLPIGYFDGLHRNYSGKAHVLIRGQKAPMVGNICMDYMMVDVTDIPNVAVGDKVLIFGEDEFGQYLSPEDLAMRGNSIVHELITCLGPRIQRIFVYEEGHQIR